MKRTLLYHGIVIAQGFRDPTFPKSFPIFAKRVSKSDGWIIPNRFQDESHYFTPEDFR